MVLLVTTTHSASTRTAATTAAAAVSTHPRAHRVGTPTALTVCYLSSLASPAKTAEPIEMPFVLWARMDARNHVLDRDPEVLRNVAVATSFET